MRSLGAALPELIAIMIANNIPAVVLWFIMKGVLHLHFTYTEIYLSSYVAWLVVRLFFGVEPEQQEEGN